MAGHSMMMMTTTAPQFPDMAGIQGQEGAVMSTDQVGQVQPLLVPAAVVMYTCVQTEQGLVCWPTEAPQPMALLPVPVVVEPVQQQPPQQVQAPQPPLSQPEPQDQPAPGRSYSAELDSATEAEGTQRRIHRSRTSETSSGASPVAQSGEAKRVKAANLPLSDALRAGGERREGAVAALEETMLRRCLDSDGCREVQVAIQVLDGRVLARLLRKLQGHAFALSKSPHGNYVMQKVIEVMPTTQLTFIAEELRACAVKAARHRYACRVLCRLLEHCGGEAGVVDVIDELLEHAEELCRHPFAHYVIEAVVEHGQPQHKHKVFEALGLDLLRNSTDRHAVFVIEAVLKWCALEDQQALAEALLVAGADALLALGQTRFGSHVLRALLKFPAAVEGIRREAEALWETKYGCRLLKEMGVEPETAKAVAAVAA